MIEKAAKTFGAITLAVLVFIVILLLFGTTEERQWDIGITTFCLIWGVNAFNMAGVFKREEESKPPLWIRRLLIVAGISLPSAFISAAVFRYSLPWLMAIGLGSFFIAVVGIVVKVNAEKEL